MNVVSQISKQWEQKLELNLSRGVHIKHGKRFFEHCKEIRRNSNDYLIIAPWAYNIKIVFSQVVQILLEEYRGASQWAVLKMSVKGKSKAVFCFKNHTFYMIFIENHLLSRVFIIAIHRKGLVHPLLKDIRGRMLICSMNIYLTIRLRGRVFYEQIVNEAQPS